MRFENEKIERQYLDAKELHGFLIDQNEISFASYIDNTYKKVLLLSVASYFEFIIVKIIKEYAERIGASDLRLSVFVEKKALTRQYHTLFDWKTKKTNQFWGFFGDDTKKKVRDIISADETLGKAEASFMELGMQRNLLVHENYSEYDVNLTVDEIYDKYKKALGFIEFVNNTLISVDL